MKCGVCGVYSVEWRVECVECTVWSGEWSVECERVKCGV